MKRRGSGETSLIKQFVRGLYKPLAIRTSELMARLLGVKNESQNVVVYKEVVKETVI